MSYLILAYLTAGSLYGGYIAVLRYRERALSRPGETRGHGRVR